MTTKEAVPELMLKTKYAIILDAGSSGTRLHVYRWEEYNKKSPSPPAIDLVYEKQQKEGGIAKLAKVAIHGKDPAAIEPALETFVESYLKPLFEKAHVICALVGVKPEDVPLLLLGTAGLRDYAQEDENQVNYNKLMEVTKTYVKNQKFNVKDGYFGAISGEEEALYGWIAANYSLGFFSRYNERNSKTVGYLEMGGASAQIAFSADATDNSDKFRDDMTTVTVGHYDFDLFLKSHPLGANTAWEKYNDKFVRQTQGEIRDVARPFGFMREDNGTKIIGNLDDHEALEELRRRALTVMKDLLGGEIREAFFPDDSDKLRAAIEKRPFVGGASFWYSTRGLFGKDPEGNPNKTAFDYRECRREVQELAILTWNALEGRSRREAEAEVQGKKKEAAREDDAAVAKRIEKETGTKMGFWERAWFMAQWINCVLVEGFGIYDAEGKARGADDDETDEDKLSFRPYNGPDGGAALNWTLGRIVLLATGDPKPVKTDDGVAHLLEEAQETISGRVKGLQHELNTLLDRKTSLDDRLRSAGANKTKLEAQAKKLDKNIQAKRRLLKEAKDILVKHRFNEAETE